LYRERTLNYDEAKLTKKSYLISLNSGACGVSALTSLISNENIHCLYHWSFFRDFRSLMGNWKE